ncbi:hypothetical protein GAN17_25480 (plasmid) [Mycobacterium kubicae]|uniref:DUF5631 domain-containing protein n=1 Tax=Mycobacterium kubicae TaxID=120959 RepID=UPI00163E58BD|nr:DUF5631 domain-containing protein [Mycobacterium kubicae]QNI09752.1 hypothetical protein GAN17_25480 [Mycobacterium kubicae]QNI15243.1 hypothetical protein GAN18_29110 [Mycobacterium kubicae]
MAGVMGGADWRALPYATVISAGNVWNPGSEHGQMHSAKRDSFAEIHTEAAANQQQIFEMLAGADVAGVSADNLMQAHQRARVTHSNNADGHDAKARGYAQAADIYTALDSSVRRIVVDAHQQIAKLKGSAAQREAAKAVILAEATEDYQRVYACAEAEMLAAGQQMLAGMARAHGREMQSIHSHLTPHGKTPKVTAAGFGTGGPPPAAPAPPTRTLGHEYVGPSSPPLPDGAGGGLAGQLVSPPAPTAPAPSAPAAPAAPAAPRVPAAPIVSGAPGVAGGAAASAGAKAPIPAGFNPGGAVSAALSGAARAVPTVVAPVVIAPHIAAAGAPVAPAVAPVMDHGGAMVSHAAPAAPVTAPPPAAAAPAAPMTPMTPMTPEPHGPLPPYGSDVRMVAATAPASPPLAPTPGPVLGSAPAAPVPGPALVRTVAAVTPAPVAGPSGGGVVLGQAAAASAGAAAGKVAADSVEQARCDDFAGAMAAQEPRLRWVAASRPDGVTMVATDLGGGWVPPGVGVPRSADLPAPGALVSLRDLVRGSGFHTELAPGHDTSGVAGVELSDTPRKLAPVSDLGWQLRQATQWRDGLPRVAHTLATAWAKGGGALPAELVELHGAMDAQRQLVLADYARSDGEVNAHELGNWMLLAAIDAVHNDQLMLADYHFRWFGTTVRT